MGGISLQRSLFPDFVILGEAVEQRGIEKVIEIQ
jgi:hypothetical protein